IRSYRTETGETKIFKPVEHFERLRISAESLNLPYPWHADELIKATYEVLAKNNFQNAYIRPVVYAPANMTFATNTVSHIV
ncbi:aminotransferase class IV, partial [Enterobacter cloacae]|uniref:aminotransferase class IV n=1 Tax=Enterobacter cloacae TaxID=550 RepID=UPI0019545A9C